MASFVERAGSQGEGTAKVHEPHRLCLLPTRRRPTDRSALHSRFIRAQEQAGVRVRRFHDLRHTFGSLAIQQFDLVAVQDMMGHSKLTTTEPYPHSKPRPRRCREVDEHLLLAAMSCLHASRRSLRQDGPMPERPPAIQRLNSLLGAATIAHEIIFETRRELIATDRGNPEQARLLAESAQIVTVELPRLSATARQLSAKWREQSLLDSRGAEETLVELESELERIEPKIDSALGRQREIAAQLRAMRQR